MHLLHAEYLLALGVIVPAILALRYAAFRAQADARRKYGEERLLDRYSERRDLRSYMKWTAVWVAAAALLVVAISGPVTTQAPTSVAAGSSQIVAVMDVSKSMGAEDYRGQMPGSPAGSTPADGASGARLDMAKYALSQIARTAAGNQIGLVTYSGNGFAQCDLTTDYESLSWIADNFVHIGSAPGGGSNYADGLRQALAVFKRDEDKSKNRVIVLFSDGGYTGNPDELSKVVQDIQAAGIRLVIVGLGSSEPTPIPQYDSAGKYTGYLSQGKGGPVTTTIDEAALQQLAATAGSEYHSLPPGQTSLGIRWAKALGGSRPEAAGTHIYWVFLGAAYVLLFVLSLSGFSRTKRDVR